MMPIVQGCCCTSTGGYKHALAAMRWLGGEHPYGYLTPAEHSGTNVCADVDNNWWDANPCPGSVCSSYIAYSPDPPDHKYLGFQLEIRWNHVETRKVTCATCVTTDTVLTYHFRRSYDSHTDKYSGEGLTTEIITWDETFVDSVTPANSYETHLTGSDALAKFNTMNPPYTSLDAACGHLQPPDPLAGSDADWNVGSEEVTDTTCAVSATIDIDVTTSQPCTCDGLSYDDTDHHTKLADFNITTILYDKFTSADLYDETKTLLALWNLGDDTHYPWRTTCSGEGYHFGAMVTFDYGGLITGVPGAVVGGPYDGEVWNSGAHSLTGYSAEGMSGGSVWYNNTESVWGYTSDYLIVGKWAEKKVTLPSHNYARPCGATDAAALEDDLVTHCYPGIADPCVDPCNNTTSTGDYTTLERNWPGRVRQEAYRMNNMASVCPGGSPCSDAHAYTVDPTWINTCTQENASTGTILYCSPNTEDFGASPTEQRGTFPASTDTAIADDKYGYLWQFHIRQFMPDPLIECPGMYASPDLIPLEESRCSEPGGCPSLPTGAIFYCPDADETGCGFQDSYGLQCPPL